MKKKYLSVIVMLFFVSKSFAQLTGIKNIPGDYATMALAITDLNAQGVGAGGVTLNLIAANAQTTPVGGYVIGRTGNILVGATNPTAANPVIIEGNGNTITAFAPQATGTLTDAIFKIIGADYITIRNFTMRENPANTTNAPAGSNNMTEFGVALLVESSTNGSKSNTILNNTISLNKSYTNTFGIYSNVKHSYLDVTAAGEISSVNGSNSGNKIYGNSISNVNYGVVFIGSVTAAYMDNANEIGGSSAATGNNFTNWGTGAVLSAFVSLNTNNYCIYVNHQINENVSYNTITSATYTAVNTFGGICKDYSGGQPDAAIATTSTISYNSITLLKNATNNGFVIAIYSAGLNATVNLVSISITNNTILNSSITNAAGTPCSFYGVYNISTPRTLGINNNVLRGNSITGANGSFSGILNTGAVTNTININNNEIGNASGGAIALSAASTGSITGINNTGATLNTTININNNTVQGITAVSTGLLYGINNAGNAGVAVNINNNVLGTASGNFISFSAAQTNTLYGIYNTGGITSLTSFSMSNNDIRGIVHTVTASCEHRYIYNSIAGFINNTNNNTFTNITANTTGSIYFINKAGAFATFPGTDTCNNNSIVTAYNKTAAGGTVYFYYSTALSTNGSVMIQSGNDFSNVTVTGATAINGWYNYDGTGTSFGPTKKITGNTFNVITGGTGDIHVMDIDRSGINSSVMNNTIRTINGSGNIMGIYYGPNNGQGTHHVSGNTISSLTSSGNNAFLYGIITGTTTLPVLNIDSNIVRNISGSGTGTTFASGIFVFFGTTINVAWNKVYSISQTGAITSGAAAVNGISLWGGNTVNAYNNFVANLTTPNVSLTDAVRGISVESATAASAYNLYNNSVYINAATTGANFGSSGIYHTTSGTATTATLKMINNIIVNTSTAKGTGLTAAYRRSNTTLTNFSAASNNNLLYAGAPSATRLIFFDGTNSDPTLAAYQARVAARETNSITALPNFVSATDLHVTNDNCAIDNKGIPIAGITNDIDIDTRSITVPDIGADEFTAYNTGVLAGVVSTAVCENKAVVNTGTIFKNAGCNLIAKVLPSGGSPVAGNVNACVTRDASQLYFNGEPYVQRHHDMEPVISPATATATVTLYYTDAEFIAYNTNNPTWPTLPTNGVGNTIANRNNVRVTQFHGTPTGGLPTTTPGNYTGTRILIVPGESNVVWNGSYWSVTFSVTGFSGFYLHTTLTNAPLPIVVNYLNGHKQGGNHVLDWKVTCVSTPRATMTLERSSDARNFTGMYTITADAARCAQPFDYADTNPLKGMNYYRLKIVDADGKITYSTTVALLNAVKGFDIVSIAPNPVVNNSFKLNVASAQAGKMEINIFDMQGRLVNRQSVSLIAGYNSLPVDVTNLAKGTYNISAISSENRSRTIRFVKQ